MAAEGSLRLLGRGIALPPGPWVVAAAGHGRATGVAPAGYGAIAGVLLLRPPGVVPDGFVAIHTNLLPVREGWGQPSDCVARDALFTAATEPRDLRMGCAFVRTAAAADPGLAALPAFAAGVRAGLDMAARLPPVLLVAGWRVGDRSDMVDLRYGMAPPPAAPGANLPEGLLGWTSGVAAADPARARVVESLGRWAVFGQAAAARQMLSETVAPTALPPPLGSDLQTERDLPAWRLGLYKLASYRVASTTQSFILASLLAGNMATGVVVAFWQGITHSAVFYGNELAWEWPRRLPVTDLAGPAS